MIRFGGPFSTVAYSRPRHFGGIGVIRNTAVSRNLLMDRVWPGMVVGDEALTNAINKLRKAFGDDRQNPQIIETIPKVGYRLIAPVRHIQPVTPEQQAESIIETTTRAYRNYLTVIALVTICLAVFFYVMFISLVVFIWWFLYNGPTIFNI